MGPNRRMVFVSATLGAGGAERVISILANALARSGCKVDLVVLEGAAHDPFYPLDPSIGVHPLGIAHPSSGLAQSVINNLGRLRVLRKCLRDLGPDCVISFASEVNILTLLATIGTGLRVIVSERSDPVQIPANRWWRMLRRVSYWMADAVVVQTKSAARHFNYLAAGKCHVIANPVEAPPQNVDEIEVSAPFIVAAGRLEPLKGFDVLIDAFAQVAPDFPQWSVVVLGEGHRREALQAQAQEHGLAARVILPGLVSNPGNYFQAADMFVLSSRLEGFPNALCEAMASGLASIASDCRNGPADIIANGENGVLVPVDDIIALAKEMARLMGNEAERQRLGTNAARLAETHSTPRIVELWNNLIEPS